MSRKRKAFRWIMQRIQIHLETRVLSIFKLDFFFLKGIKVEVECTLKVSPDYFSNENVESNSHYAYHYHATKYLLIGCPIQSMYYN